MSGARALPGLPPYGPSARSFPSPSAISEGFVVEFETKSGDVWVGNFAKWDERASSINCELGSRAVVVVAGGAGYLVDIEDQRLVRDLGFDIRGVWFAAETDAMVITNGLWAEAFNAGKMLWQSRRFSWDGIRNAIRSEACVTGEAYDPMTDGWLPFHLDLTTGHVIGGSYNGPD